MAEQTQVKIKSTITRLMVLAVAMFAFAMWVMPPLYDLFCEVTGINGKTYGKYEAVSAEVDKTRTVEVQFIGTNNENMPWGFKPETFSIDVHPGEAVVTHFLARNPTDRIMVGQAVPSIAPSNASAYFHKVECFCFNQQALGPQESAELGLRFIVDQALPKGVKTITMSYTLFDITQDSPDVVLSKAKELEANNPEEIKTELLQNDTEQQLEDNQNSKNDLLTAN